MLGTEKSINLTGLKRVRGKKIRNIFGIIILKKLLKKIKRKTREKKIQKKIR
jgi:hypothetical protein